MKSKAGVKYIDFTTRRRFDGGGERVCTELIMYSMYMKGMAVLVPRLFVSVA